MRFSEFLKPIFAYISSHSAFRDIRPPTLFHFLPFVGHMPSFIKFCREVFEIVYKTPLFLYEEKGKRQRVRRGPLPAPQRPKMCQKTRPPREWVAGGASIGAGRRKPCYRKATDYGRCTGKWALTLSLMPDVRGERTCEMIETMWG